MRAFAVVAVLGTCCCSCHSAEASVSPARYLREGNADGGGGVDERSPAKLAAANALRQLAAVEVDQGAGQSSATGGSLFAMEKSRTYEGHRLSPEQPMSTFSTPPESEMCDRWAVLTSIFDPTDTVRQLADADGWCVVVVGDKKGPAEYDVPGVTYLTPEDQEDLPYRIVSMLPWNHFGRKNIGYLYAVHHGAKVVYDVDDDNALIFPDAGVPHAASGYTPASTTSFAIGPDAFVHNPYACFGAPGNVWPRGFPLDAVNDADSNRCDFVSVEDALGEAGPEGRPLGVVQALANHDPDVDAVYRLTHPPGGLPFDFEPDEEPLAEGMSPLKIVPPDAFTPYNAQATLHFPPAFWGMLLPVTVHGRVSDIWRSYFTQTLLPSTGAVTAFAPASVEQIRNPHNYLADFQAELPLYEQSGALVSFLGEHRSQSAAASQAGVSLPERIDALMVEMYEYGILGEADVELSQAWIEDLFSIGYNPTS
ncbi:unnamed protein product [Scytosiphon promiscuus]